MHLIEIPPSQHPSVTAAALQQEAIDRASSACRARLIERTVAPPRRKVHICHSWNRAPGAEQMHHTTVAVPHALYLRGVKLFPALGHKSVHGLFQQAAIDVITSDTAEVKTSWSQVVCAVVNARLVRYERAKGQESYIDSMRRGLAGMPHLPAENDELESASVTDGAAAAEEAEALWLEADAARHEVGL